MSIKVALPLSVHDLTISLTHSTLLYSGSTCLYAQFYLDNDFWRLAADDGEVDVAFQVDDTFYVTKMVSVDAKYYCIIPAEVMAKPNHIRIGISTQGVSTNMLPLDIYEGTPQNIGEQQNEDEEDVVQK